MSSWEDIANEVVPSGVRSRGLATGANRGGSVGHRPMNVSSRGVPTHPSPRLVAPPPCAYDACLDTALNGLHAENEHGAFYRITRRAHEFDPVYDDLCSHLGESLGHLSRQLRSLCEADHLLFMDIETTGLSSRDPLFLIGTLRQENGSAVVEFFLARGYDEECAALAAFHSICEGKALVTFNGKSFDWPYIQGRSLRHGLANSTPRGHFDLLHHARSKWKGRVPNCRLQTLELYFCGRQRDGDIASANIPRQYRQFAQGYSGGGHGAYLLAPIIHHNAWDVLTMADLLRYCHEPYLPSHI